MSEDRVIDDGGPAFPWQWTDHLPEVGNVVRDQGFGLSLRDWFAGMALQGILSGDWSDSAESCVKKAYAAADMMILERSKR